MQAHLMISGTVQGVGYRYFVRDNARRLGLTGFVRNTTNGKVQVVLQGEKEKIEKLIKLCHEGPQFAEVNDVEVEWELVDESGQERTEKFVDFSIR